MQKQQRIETEKKTVLDNNSVLPLIITLLQDFIYIPLYLRRSWNYFYAPNDFLVWKYKTSAWPTNARIKSLVGVARKILTIALTKEKDTVLRYKRARSSHRPSNFRKMIYIIRPAVGHQARATKIYSLVVHDTLFPFPLAMPLREWLIHHTRGLWQL